MVLFYCSVVGIWLLQLVSADSNDGLGQSETSGDGPLVSNIVDTIEGIVTMTIIMTRGGNVGI